MATPGGNLSKTPSEESVISVNTTNLKPQSGTNWRSTLDQINAKDGLITSLGLCVAFLVLEVAKQLLTYSTKYHNGGKYPVDSSLIIAVCELVKLVVCFVSMATEQGPRLKHPSVLFIIPAVLYVVNNNIYLVALNYTTPPIWILLIQTRIVMTALVYKYVMGRVVTSLKWVSLVGLTVGIVVSQLSPEAGSVAINAMAVILALIAAVVSVANSVYVEHLLKTYPGSFMEQQVQLYAYSLVASVLWWFVSIQPQTNVYLGSLGTTIEHPSWFDVVRWSLASLTNQDRKTTDMLWGTIAVSSVGGLVVAAIMKRLDNLAKIFTAALATMVTGFFSEMLFPDKFSFTFPFFLGNVIVVIATVTYSRSS